MFVCRILNGSKKQRKRRKKSGRKAAAAASEDEGGGVGVEKKALYVSLRTTDDDGDMVDLEANDDELFLTTTKIGANDNYSDSEENGGGNGEQQKGESKHIIYLYIWRILDIFGQMNGGLCVSKMSLSSVSRVSLSETSNDLFVTGEGSLTEGLCFNVMIGVTIMVVILAIGSAMLWTAQRLMNVSQVRTIVISGGSDRETTYLFFSNP